MEPGDGGVMAEVVVPAEVDDIEAEKDAGIVVAPHEKGIIEIPVTFPLSQEMREMSKA
jgi:hypothetical protein